MNKSKIIDGNKMYISFWTSKCLPCYVNFNNFIDQQSGTHPEYVNLHEKTLKEYNAHFVRVLKGDDYIQFDSEEFLTLFVLRWS